MISVKILHQKLDYLEEKQLIQMKNNIKNFEIIDMKDFSDLKNYRIYIKIKKMKLQKHSAAI